MSERRKPSAELDQSPTRRAAGDRLQRRSAGERFAHLSDRLARSLPPGLRNGAADDDPEPEGRLVPAPAHGSEVGLEPAEDLDYSIDDELAAWYEAVPRFPVVRSGYDTAAVDEHIARLEQELSELDRELAETRARTPSEDEVRAEIQRIGEQTSAILVAAHDRARDTTRRAQEEADRCVADATRRARSVTAEADNQVHAAQRELEDLTAQRARLLADMQSLAATLSTVAREASGRFAEGAGAADELAEASADDTAAEQ